MKLEDKVYFGNTDLGKVRFEASDADIALEYGISRPEGIVAKRKLSHEKGWRIWSVVKNGERWIGFVTDYWKDPTGSTSSQTHYSTKGYVKREDATAKIRAKYFKKSGYKNNFEKYLICTYGDWIAVATRGYFDTWDVTLEAGNHVYTKENTNTYAGAVKRAKAMLRAMVGGDKKIRITSAADAQPEVSSLRKFGKSHFSDASSSPILADLIDKKILPQGGWRATGASDGELSVAFETENLARNFSMRSAENGYAATTPIAVAGGYWSVCATVGAGKSVMQRIPNDDAHSFKNFDDPWKAMSPQDRKDANMWFRKAMTAPPSSIIQKEYHDKLVVILKKYNIGERWKINNNKEGL